MPSISKGMTTVSSCSVPNGANDRLQRAHPAQRSGPATRPCPSASTSAREILDDSGHDVSNDLLGGAAWLGNDGNVEIALLRIARRPALPKWKTGRRRAESPRSPFHWHRCAAPCAPRAHRRSAPSGRECPASVAAASNIRAHPHRTDPPPRAHLSTSFFRSPAALRCMRAGISSERSSRRRSGMELSLR